MQRSAKQRMKPIDYGRECTMFQSQEPPKRTSTTTYHMTCTKKNTEKAEINIQYSLPIFVHILTIHWSTYYQLYYKFYEHHKIFNIQKHIITNITKDGEKTSAIHLNE
jgi:hypothetical protein